MLRAAGELRKRSGTSPRTRDREAKSDPHADTLLPSPTRGSGAVPAGGPGPWSRRSGSRVVGRARSGSRSVVPARSGSRRVVAAMLRRYVGNRAGNLGMVYNPRAGPGGASWPVAVALGWPGWRIVAPGVAWVAHCGPWGGLGGALWPLGWPG